MTINLNQRIARTAFAFRGYNRPIWAAQAKLLADPRYADTVRSHLERASAVCEDAAGRRIDLAARVERGEETDLKCYAEAVAMVVAVEAAQIEILRTRYEVDYPQAALSYGYSLGEISALVCARRVGNGAGVADSAPFGRRLRGPGERRDAGNLVFPRGGAAVA